MIIARSMLRSFLDLLKLYTSIKFCGFPHYVACACTSTSRLPKVGCCLLCRITSRPSLPWKPICRLLYAHAPCILAAVGILLLFQHDRFSTAGFLGLSKLTKTEMANGGTTPFVILVVIIILVLLNTVCQLKKWNNFGLSFLHKPKNSFLCTNTMIIWYVIFGNTVYCVLIFHEHIPL